MSRLTTTLILTLPLLFGASVCQAQSLPRVSLEIENESLADVLKGLARKHKLNYVVSRKAITEAGAVDCMLTDVPLDRAVQMLCAACNLEAEVSGRFVVIRVPKRGERPRVALPVEEPGARTEPSRAGGIFPEGKAPKAAPKPEPKPEPEPAKPEPLEPSGSVIGWVRAKEGRVITVEDQYKEVREYRLKKASPTRRDPDLQKLVEAIRRLRIGDKVVMTYESDESGQRWIQAVIGGRDPRDRSTMTVPKKKAGEKSGG